MKSWLEEKDIEMCSTVNEGKSVVAERFIRALKNKSYNYMTSISKNVDIDKLDDIVNKYNNTYHKAIKIKPFDGKPRTYVDSSKEINYHLNYLKFKIGDIVIISKYKNIFAKCFVPNWSEEVFVIKKVKNTLPWRYIISDLKEEEIVGVFYKKELQKSNQKEIRAEKIIKKNGDAK